MERYIRNQLVHHFPSPTTTQWAKVSLNCLQNSSPICRKTHIVRISIHSYRLLIVVSVDKKELQQWSVRSRTSLRCLNTHIGTRASGRTVHQASLTKPSLAGYTNSSSPSAILTNSPTTCSMSLTRTRTEPSISKSSSVLSVSQVAAS